MTQDEIAMLAANTFDSEWIEALKKVLFEVCPTTQRCVSHKGAQKDENKIKSCLKVMNECGENIPRFVMHYLDELPPVTFTSLDVSNLQVKLECLQADVCSMKRTMQLRANVSEDTQTIAADLDCQVPALEDPTNQIAGEGRADLSETGGAPVQWLNHGAPSWVMPRLERHGREPWSPPTGAGHQRQRQLRCLTPSAVYLPGVLEDRLLKLAPLSRVRL